MVGLETWKTVVAAALATTMLASGPAVQAAAIVAIPAGGAVPAVAPAAELMQRERGPERNGRSDRASRSAREIREPRGDRPGERSARARDHSWSGSRSRNEWRGGSDWRGGREGRVQRSDRAEQRRRWSSDRRAESDARRDRSGTTFGQRTREASRVVESRSDRDGDRSSARWSDGRSWRDNRGRNEWRDSRNRSDWRSRTEWRDGRRHHRDERRWDRSWRDHASYNWRDYRVRNRTLYRAGRYHAPYRDYRYRRIGVGFTLGSPFYGSHYWISDPWRYRLPAVYGSYRWVRYYDDVLLVDLHSGRVFDVINDFFW